MDKAHITCTTYYSRHARRILRIFFGCLTVFILTCVCTATTHAQGGCPPGIPCDTPLTDNDPYDDVISPNVSGAPNAPKTTSNACDADFMNQIYARAYIEAERENVINEVLIRKPDSVLEYTCFDQQVKLTGVEGGKRFSDSDYWDDYTVDIDGKIGDTTVDSVDIDVYMCNDSGGTDGECDKLDKSLDVLVLETLKPYIEENFDHDFLGGKMTGVDADLKYKTSEITDYYTCDHMSNTHFLAKCNNMITDDQFYSFDTLINLDPRILPEQCPDGTEITQARIDIAKNEGRRYVHFDQVKTYMNKVTSDECGEPIPTGVTSIILSTDASQGNRLFSSKKEHPDFICSNPGCWYNKDSKQCEKSGGN